MDVKRQILEKIKEYDVITIHGHTRPDGDCYGCQFGLKSIIKATWPQKEVYAVGETTNYVSFVGTPDIIDDSKFTNALAICVDCGNQERLADQRFNLAKEVIKIDHHIPVTPYGDIMWVEEEKPACSQMIYEFYNTFRDELKITEDGLIALYTGIVTDTGRFRFRSVTKDTFMAAGDLVSMGVDVSYIDSKLSIESLEVIKFKGYVLSNFKMTDNGFAYITVKKEIIDQYNISYEDAANQVNLIGTLPTCPVWALIIEYPTEIRIRLRCRKGRVDLLANEYNGGGHEMAAGAKLPSWDALDEFVLKADELVKSL